MVESTDLELARQLARGDEQAASLLVARYGDGLYNFFVWRCRAEAAAAEDLVQETMLAAVRGIRTYRGRASLGTWLIAIARRRWVSRLRRKDPRGATTADDVDGAAADFAADGPLPEEDLERAEVRDAVRAALSTMPPDEAAALEAQYRDEMSVADVAARVGRSVKATESLLNRARVRFRRVFSQLRSEFRE